VSRLTDDKPLDFARADDRTMFIGGSLHRRYGVSAVGADEVKNRDVVQKPALAIAIVMTAAAAESNEPRQQIHTFLSTAGDTA